MSGPNGTSHRRHVPATMKAVVLKAPFDIQVEEVPVPQLRRDTTFSSRCFRPVCVPYNFITGHEAVGEIVQTGNGVKLFKVGDRVICPFSINCGECFFCKKGYTGRCANMETFGNPITAGVHAEYFRAPLADTSLLLLPQDIPADLCVLLTDILPTGTSTAVNAKRLLDEDRAPWGADGQLPWTDRNQLDDVCVVIGCGPVGLCAISAAKTLFRTVFATDLAPHRLKGAEKHGAIALPLDELRPAVLKATDGRGADAVLDVVGHESAIKTAAELARLCGVISSAGVYTKPAHLDINMFYAKNLRFQFGRCSVRKFQPYAIEILRKNQKLFSEFVENKIKLEEAAKYFALFEQNKIAKTIFVCSE